MKCRMKKRLSAYIDGELDRGEALRLEHHLKECSECREQVRSLKAVWDLLLALPSARDNPVLYTRVKAELDSGTQRHWVERILIPAVSIAAVALGVFLGSLAGNQNGSAVAVTDVDFYPVQLDETSDPTLGDTYIEFASQQMSLRDRR